MIYSCNTGQASTCRQNYVCSWVVTVRDIVFKRVILALIVLAGCILYSNTLGYREINYDGIYYLLKNPLLKDLDYYTQLHDIFDFSLLDDQLGLNPDIVTSFMLRPLSFLSFSINYLTTGMNPMGFRVVNLAIHIINSLLVFACVQLFLVLAPSGKKLSHFSSRFIPAAVALVFLLHPMQTESVTYIMQRFASLAAMFYLATIWLYLVWQHRIQQGIKPGYARWGSVAVLFFGMFVRESLFTAPFLIMLLELTLFDNSFKSGLKRAAPHLMLLPVIPLMVILVSAAQSSSLSVSGVINVVNYDRNPVLSYVLTQVVVVLLYLRLYLLPYGQNVDPDQTLYTSLSQLPVLASTFSIVLLVTGTYLLYRKNREDVRYVLILTGVIWYFLALSPSSSFIPQPDFMAEHRAYFASVGIITAFICLLDLMRSAVKIKEMNRLLVLGVAVWCVVLAALTYKRNAVWQSGRTLWSDAVKKSPDKDRPWLNLGSAYVSSGEYGNAVKCFQKAVELSPDWGKAYEGLAWSLLQLGRFHDVGETSLKGISVDPANSFLYNLLGVAYAKLERTDDAKQAFSTAIALRPGYMEAMVNKDRIESFMETSAGRKR